MRARVLAAITVLAGCPAPQPQPSYYTKQQAPPQEQSGPPGGQPDGYQQPWPQQGQQGPQQPWPQQQDQPPPQAAGRVAPIPFGMMNGTSTCAGIVGCYSRCPSATEACMSTCDGGALPALRVKTRAFAACSIQNRCADESCSTTRCATQLTLCFGASPAFVGSARGG